MPHTNARPYNIAWPAPITGRADGYARMLGVGVSSARFLRMVERLAEVESAQTRDYTSYSVRGRRFGYHWPRTSTVGLKQTLSEQAALVAERPDVFEVQFTSGGFGWVVVHLAGIDADELAELVYEGWCLSAPEELVDRHPLTPAPPPGAGR
ncbi:hypothetical protein GCM10022225_09850 [Plantactinospora mayteni]|uniref:YjbR protein n=1 Tax=Plantactinospora mayteni TaxID=566021 RepID=A0ABQ4EHR5_9ACTN|nr:hypothetical protein Pma05_08390 [Plantactinospora mayteni]